MNKAVIAQKNHYAENRKHDNQRDLDLFHINTRLAQSAMIFSRNAGRRYAYSRPVKASQIALFAAIFD